MLQLGRARSIANLYWTQLPQQYLPHVRATNAHLPADVLEILQGTPLSLSLYDSPHASQYEVLWIHLSHHCFQLEGYDDSLAELAKDLPEITTVVTGLIIEYRPSLVSFMVR
jgi:hypothetical protein